ncbi:MAG: NTP transferase domain-containing protein [Thermoflavifilum sp.]|nr:NTP transferase domain-containing protein [Thermoflavifilum sp.]
MMPEVIILAGGLGTRLRSVLPKLPKVLAPIGNRPFLHYLLHYLSGQQISRVILSLGYQHEQVLKWLADNRSTYPLEIFPIVEPYPLGTGGAIGLSMRFVQTYTACILNGDTYFPISLAEMQKFHEQMGKPITLATCYVPQTTRFGCVEIDEDQHVVKSFQEKQSAHAGWINAGVYCIHTQWWMAQRWAEKFSFEKDVLETFTHSHALAVAAFQASAFFIDLGVPEDYQRAQTLIPAHAGIS